MNKAFQRFNNDEKWIQMNEVNSKDEKKIKEIKKKLRKINQT